MPGRQAHGRSLISAPKSKSNAKKKSKARAQKNALNAFGIAEEHFPEKIKKTPRVRQLDAEIERKHGRDEEDDEEDEDEEDMPRRKKVKAPRPGDGDAEHGSDSEGNEWMLGGMAEDDEDSEIESDDAFGDSDNERFDEYTFRGSKSTKQQKRDEDDSEDDSNDEEGETLGEEAIDLATALDQWEEDSDTEKKDGPKHDSDEESGSESSEGSDDDGSEDDDDSDDSDEGEDEDEEADPEQLKALRGLVSGFGGEEDEDQVKAPVKQKINLGDLGLNSLDDPMMKNSVKLMKKEQKEKRPGANKKLDVPLARRQQDRLDRSVAYDKTNETLDRWTETVKQNRRAEHLIFPLAENSEKAGLDTTEMQPLTASNSNNELEAAVLSIMGQSGLSLEKESKPKETVYDDEGNELTRKEILAMKRRERELNSREAKRAARIKKIKSKAYHRVHRKEKERNEIAAREGEEIDSEEEREAQDRRRALERVGQRHRDSKWAKLGSKAKRAVWDEDYRTGLTEMTRKDEELRRRKEGKRAASDDDETSSSGSDSEDGGNASLRRQLLALEEEDGEPQSGLMSMKFMQKAEAARKKENDDLIQQIRKELDGDEGSEGSDDEAGGEVGRKQYGVAGKAFAPALDTSKRAPKKSQTIEDDNDEVDIKITSSAKASASQQIPESTANTTVGGWSSGNVRRNKKGSSAKMDDFDVNADITIASSAPKKSKSASKSLANSSAPAADDDDDSDVDQHLPLAIRDQKLVARAFAGEEVFADFTKEKDEVAEADDDKVVDNTLPGWGSWVGDGVSNREKKRHQGRFLTKVEGIKKKDRKDAKLDKVIINEKRIKKNDRYLASQLPHPFESRQQYERALRLPVGPEWQTKETFQDNTKPRVIMKQGIIAPMSKPRA